MFYTAGELEPLRRGIGLCVAKTFKGWVYSIYLTFYKYQSKEVCLTIRLHSWFPWVRLFWFNTLFHPNFINTNGFFKYKSKARSRG